jgi:hypothetical protein
MSDAELAKRTRSALERSGHCPWLPELTHDLARIAWGALYQQAGLSPSNYGTSRAIAKSLDAPRKVVAYLSTSGAVEVLDENLALYNERAGIEFYTAKEITGADLLCGVNNAIDFIKRVPTLYSTVAVLVRSLHLIKPPDDEYDVSFSEPHLPFSIFVSGPRECGLTNSLRIAEGIVHEAMHLQLTLIEQVVPLVNSANGEYFSPWRNQHRPAQGVLHAVYVFKVIHRFIENLLPQFVHSVDCLGYLRRRRSEIKNQMREVESFQGCPDLTESGKSLMKALISLPL